MLLRPSVAVMVQVWLAVTIDVRIGKVAELAVNGTETVAGGFALELSLDILMLTPPGGAGVIGILAGGSGCGEGT